jgi:galactose oxidase
VLWWPPYSNGDNPTLWDPSTQTNTAAPKVYGPGSPPTLVNIFCSGHAFLPDGRLLQAGGHIANYDGLNSAYIYTPSTSSTGSWTNSPGLPVMNAGRWYPTATTLPNGDILVISGYMKGSTASDNNTLPQVWQSATNSWRNLSSAKLVLPFYPYMFVAPNGKVFYAGPSQVTRYLDVCGTGSWGSVVMYRNYPTRNWGSAVMYDDGKVLVTGGTTCGFYDTSSTCANLPTATTEIIDLKSSSPAWQYAGKMAVGRKLHNATLLPDGKVLVTGGDSGPGGRSGGNAVLQTELWDPPPPSGNGNNGTGTWSTMASIPTSRAYHSIALLLPNGKVLSAGGDTKVTAEIYSPPYLFNSNGSASQPTISSVSSTSIGYNSTFTVKTPDGGGISKVTMLALGSVTHNFNQTQRINFLSYQKITNLDGSVDLKITTPSSGNSAPPGYYMLFILNSSGVPSVARIVQIRLTAPAAPANLTATAGSSAGQIKLSWTDKSNNETGFKIERSTDATNFTQIATAASCSTSYVDTGRTSSNTYYYQVRAYNSIGNSAYSNTASATAP